MRDLDQSDAALVLGAISELLGHPVEGLTDQVLQVLYELIPCEVVSYNEVNHLTRQSRSTVFPEAWIPILHETFEVLERVVFDHPLVLHSDKTTLLTAVRFEDVVNDKSLLETAFYREFLAPVGQRYLLATALPSAPWTTLCIAFSRAADRPFSNREAALLDAITPCLAHCYRHVQLNESHTSLIAAASKTGWAIISIDEDNCVTQIDGDPKIDITVGHHLPTEVGLRVTGPLIKNSPNTSVRSSANVERPKDIQIRTIATDQNILLVQPHQADLPTRLKSQGFTKRQIDVAQQLLAGGTNDHIARRLGISTGTVRKHLEVLYRGLNVNDRSSAIARLSDGT